MKKEWLKQYLVFWKTEKSDHHGMEWLDADDDLQAEKKAAELTEKILLLLRDDAVPAFAMDCIIYKRMAN